MCTRRAVTIISRMLCAHILSVKTHTHSDHQLPCVRLSVLSLYYVSMCAKQLPWALIKSIVFCTTEICCASDYVQFIIGECGSAYYVLHNTQCARFFSTCDTHSDSRTERAIRDKTQSICIMSTQVTHLPYNFSAVFGLAVCWLVAIVGVIPHTIFIEYIGECPEMAHTQT